jgi:hypothetical protein
MRAALTCLNTLRRPTAFRRPQYSTQGVARRFDTYAWRAIHNYVCLRSCLCVVGTGVSESSGFQWGARLLGPRRMALPTHGFPVSRIDANVVEEKVEPQTARADHAFGAVEN